MDGWGVRARARSRLPTRTRGRVPSRSLTLMPGPGVIRAFIPYPKNRPLAPDFAVANDKLGAATRHFRPGATARPARPALARPPQPRPGPAFRVASPKPRPPAAPARPAPNWCRAPVPPRSPATNFRMIVRSPAHPVHHHAPKTKKAGPVRAGPFPTAPKTILCSFPQAAALQNPGHRHFRDVPGKTNAPENTALSFAETRLRDSSLQTAQCEPSGNLPRS